MMLWVGLQCVIVVFPNHTHLLFFLHSADKTIPFLEKRVVKKNIVHLSNSELLHQSITKFYFVLYDLILYIPSTIFQINRTGLPGLNQ